MYFFFSKLDDEISSSEVTDDRNSTDEDSDEVRHKHHNTLVLKLQEGNQNSSNAKFFTIFQCTKSRVYNVFF